jgi:hypothetical protein
VVAAVAVVERRLAAQPPADEITLDPSAANGRALVVT